MANETVICTYRCRPDSEDQFLAPLNRHWTTLHALGFFTDDQAMVLRRIDEPTCVEIFTWLEGGFGRAHQHPDVLDIWEPMEPLLEDRGGQPKWEFPHYKPVVGV